MHARLLVFAVFIATSFAGTLAWLTVCLGGVRL